MNNIDELHNGHEEKTRRATMMLEARVPAFVSCNLDAMIVHTHLLTITRASPSQATMEETKGNFEALKKRHAEDAKVIKDLRAALLEKEVALNKFSDQVGHGVCRLMSFKMEALFSPRALSLACNSAFWMRQSGHTSPLWSPLQPCLGWRSTLLTPTCSSPSMPTTKASWWRCACRPPVK